jgi:hypothetical protein
MRWVIRDLDTSVLKKLKQASSPPCEDEDQSTYRELAQKLALNPTAELPSTVPGGCRRRHPIPMRPIDVLMNHTIDDPDLGMDQDLPPSADPKHDRATMGGSTGPTSQGFRHMYFGGWKLAHPIATFQIPFHAIGQAPERTQIIAELARERIRAGDLLWGTRLLAWSMHYVQDLTQPFHAVQIPSLRMVPWGSLFHGLIPETTRTIANYHYAYERYVSRLMKRAPTDNPLSDCLIAPARHASLRWDPEHQSPRKLALEAARKSVEIASALGSAEMAFFGTKLKNPEYDLPHDRGNLDYEALERDPAVKDAREHLEHVTCTALSNAVIGSRLLIRWGFAEP